MRLVVRLFALLKLLKRGVDTFMDLILQDYLENPVGKGSSIIPNKKLIIEDLQRRYEKFLQGNDLLKPTVYRIKDNYYFLFTIPSESERENTYDVVIEFSDPDKKFTSDTVIKRYKMRFFSNCPSFTFTYAYVYNDNDSLVQFLRNKYDGIVLTDAPSMRNPQEVISFEKSTYFSALYLREHSHFLNKVFLNQIGLKTNPTSLASKVRKTNQIMKEIQSEKNRLKEEKDKKGDGKTTNRSVLPSVKKTTDLSSKTKHLSHTKKITGRKPKRKLH